jgi:predicted ATPase
VIVEVVFQRDARVFRAGDRFALRPGLNVVVGPNGAGKSTLLAAAAAAVDPAQAPMLAGAARLATDAPTPAYYFDFEKDSARVSGARESALALGVSHGQYVLSVLDSLDAIAPGAALLLDEPDAPLDYKQAGALVARMRGHAKRGVQSVLSSHREGVMVAAGEVLSLEHRRWMPAGEYLASQGA